MELIPAKWLESYQKQEDMSNWYSLGLGDGIMAPVASAEIEAAFQRIFIASGMPADMAIFTHSESEGRLHCEVIAYFSPAAQAVAREFNAHPCSPPTRVGLTLLAGDEPAWSALFSEHDR